MADHHRHVIGINKSGFKLRRTTWRATSATSKCRFKMRRMTWRVTSAGRYLQVDAADGDTTDRTQLAALPTDRTEITPAPTTAPSADPPTSPPAAAATAPVPAPAAAAAAPVPAAAVPAAAVNLNPQLWQLHVDRGVRRRHAVPRGRAGGGGGGGGGRRPGGGGGDTRSVPWAGWRSRC